MAIKRISSSKCSRVHSTRGSRKSAKYFRGLSISPSQLATTAPHIAIKMRLPCTCTPAAKFLYRAPANDRQHARMNISSCRGGSSMSSVMGTVAFSTDSTEVARRPLESEHCALIVVDIQQKLLPPIFNKEMLAKNAQLLVRLAKILSIPILMTTQYSKGLGATVLEISSLLPDVTAIDKLEFGCFSSDAFRLELKSLPGSRNTVLLCGMETHICVMRSEERRVGKEC